MDLSIIWTNMLPGDSELTARKSAKILSFPHVRHFYDPNKLSGKAIAESTGHKGKIAWDIYLFYAADSQWFKGPPGPTVWVHQLTEDWADPAYFRSGDDLVEELFSMAKGLLNQ